MNDSVVWLPWVAVLSALGAVGAWRAWRVGDAAAVARRLGWALVPIAAWSLGLLVLVWRLWSALSSWAARFVWDPFAWAGLIVAGVAFLLLAGGYRWRTPSRERRDRKAVAAGVRPAGVPARPARQAAGRTGRTRASGVDDEFAEIEAMLRKRGIS